MAFCIRWPENMQFKGCNIERYMIIMCIGNYVISLMHTWRARNVKMTPYGRRSHVMNRIKSICHHFDVICMSAGYMFKI